MNLNELFASQHVTILRETVFDVLDSLPSTPNDREFYTLTALVMFVVTNNQRPGIMQLTSFYLQNNDALFAELQRLAVSHPREFAQARMYTQNHSIEHSKQLIRQFFTSKQNNVDLIPRPAKPDGPRLPQRALGGDRGKMKVAGH